MRIYTPREVGLLVHEQRLAEGITQEELAERIGATRQWVRSLESGKPRLELGLTLRALKALGCVVDVQLPAREPEAQPTAGARKRVRGAAWP
jgi:HTH-type transcriptional regulator / antitoxin HipB